MEMKKQTKLWMKLLPVLMVTAVMFFVVDTHAYAADPKLYTGTKKLIGDVGKWLLALVPTTGGAAILYQVIKKKVADGESGTVAQCNKRIQQILVGVAFGVSVSGLITWLVSYYK